MLRNIKDSELHMIEDDPVRPHITTEKRLENGRNVVVLEHDGVVRAIVCTALCYNVPLTEEEMFEFADPYGDILIAYTVWSYDRGAGRDIINALRSSAIEDNCVKLVTLSPLTEMAEKFHLRNGAKFVRKGATCQNFEYQIA